MPRPNKWLIRAGFLIKLMEAIKEMLNNSNFLKVHTNYHNLKAQQLILIKRNTISSSLMIHTFLCSNNSNNN